MKTRKWKLMKPASDAKKIKILIRVLNSEVLAGFLDSIATVLSMLMHARSMLDRWVKK
jgi:hypothetical protein